MEIKNLDDYLDELEKRAEPENEDDESYLPGMTGLTGIDDTDE